MVTQTTKDEGRVQTLPGTEFPATVGPIDLTGLELLELHHLLPRWIQSGYEYSGHFRHPYRA